MNWPFLSYIVPLFQNLSHENEFDLHKKEPVWETGEWFRFNTEQKGTQKWPILVSLIWEFNPFLPGSPRVKSSRWLSFDA